MIEGRNDLSLARWVGALVGGILGLVALIPDLRWRLPLSLLLFVGVGLVTGTVFARLMRWSFMDPTTELYNRRHFVRQLHQELARSQRHQHSFAVAILDLDEFKSFNDRYGHLTGDRVLKSCAQVAQAQLRRSDTLARWGGEEFALVLPETSAEGALAVVERIRQEVQATSVEGYLNATVSGGIALFPDDADTPDGLVGAADTALYVAKRQGNRVLLFSQAVRPQAG